MAQLQLNTLTSLVKKRKTIGRGGSRGGTSGRGHKGQKARTSGLVRASFEGGQMPLIRRLPKRGFNNKPFATIVEIVNVEDLEKFFDEGQEITKELLIQRGLINGKQGALLKILGNGSVSKKFVVHADAASQSAIKAIEKSGGRIALTQEM
jgi:large subunit ribosomal protein L15